MSIQLSTLGLFVCFFNHLMSAQQSEINNINDIKTSSLVSPSNIPATLMDLKQNQQNTSHGIYIEQIGANNTVEIFTKSQYSSIKLQQHGNENLIDVTNYSNTINLDITQKGNRNMVHDFSYGSVQQSNMELIQNGDDLTFERFGANELTNNIKFRMSGQARTVIVNSF